MDEHNQNRMKLVREAYREYLEWAKSLLVLAETSSVTESHDSEHTLRNVFRLQILYNEREALRFEGSGASTDLSRRIRVLPKGVPNDQADCS